MSGLALLARDAGAQVTGSDLGEGRYVRRLRERGVEVAVGHDAARVPADCELVYSSAVRPDNPERARVRELGLREIRRGELLGELSRLRPCIAVAGAHGKTTTAAMIVHALRAAGGRPGYAIGGELRATGTNAEWGEDEWLVVEADESDRSFLALAPQIAVVTNVALDHHREYGSLAEVEEAFRAFLAPVPRAVMWDRPALLALRSGPVVAYDAPHPRLEPEGAVFDWRAREVRLGVAGAHNARNAAGALEACRLAGADPAAAAAGLADFPGVVRRLEPVGRTPTGALVYDDYAHAATEVRATLEAARTLRPRRLVAVLEPFGPHRVRHTAREFGEALALADVSIVLEIHRPAGRPPELPEVSARVVAEAAEKAARGRTVLWMPRPGEAERWLRAHLRGGDVCVTLGAGRIEALARRLVRETDG